MRKYLCNRLKKAGGTTGPEKATFESFYYNKAQKCWVYDKKSSWTIGPHFNTKLQGKQHESD